MLAQTLVISDGKLLMVQQKTKRGKIIWNFPGGKVEKGETLQEAAIRETKEETGYEVQLLEELYKDEGKKVTFIAKVVGGELKVEDDPDLLDVRWIDLSDSEKIDDKVRHILNIGNQKDAI